jgi:hypothetical protein
LALIAVPSLVGARKRLLQGLHSSWEAAVPGQAATRKRSTYHFVIRGRWASNVVFFSSFFAPSFFSFFTGFAALAIVFLPRGIWPC